MNGPKNRPPSNRGGKKRKRAVFNPGGQNDRPNYRGSQGISDSFDKFTRPSAPSLKPKSGSVKSQPKKNHIISEIDGIKPVDLFSAYHLGITVNDQYKPQNLHDVSRRFRSSPDKIKQILVAYGLDSESVMKKDFDMGMAQLDIKVAPKGISKIELGKQLYEEFLEAREIDRNWVEELKFDEEANRNIFEKLK